MTRFLIISLTRIDAILGFQTFGFSRFGCEWCSHHTLLTITAFVIVVQVKPEFFWVTSRIFLGLAYPTYLNQSLKTFAILGFQTILFFQVLLG